MSPTDATSGCAGTAAGLGIDDLFVFVKRNARLSLMGGAGRAIGWAGVVDVDLVDEPIASETIRRGRTQRIVAGEPRRVIGPYYTGHAALIPLGDGHLVVFGHPGPIGASDGELLRAAAEAAADCEGVPSSKLLADELEVVHAVRQLMEYRPESLPETATHVASVAAEALSCEIGVVLVSDRNGTVIGGGGSGWSQIEDHPRLITALAEISERFDDDSIVEQEMAEDPLGISMVSRYALRIGTPSPFATLMLGHTSERARGFTVLCQRIGRSLADAAEVLLAQASAREALSRERDAFAMEARTDALTGLGNRIAWDEAMRREEALFNRHGQPVALLSLDVDRLKETNDRFGHGAGDEILIGAAEILASTVRTSDIIVRLGGDEFAALLPSTDAAGVESLQGRIAAASDAWRGSLPELRLSISVGSAAAGPGEPLRDAFHRADAALMQAKGAR